ncbi:arsenate reductase ArsC [Arachidicoccus terrestris]|uniref:arsenate reductase ArsC n=1 Tax=Arachidicoccus terrestris TaxID=2875539 RepID=UPI001CC4B67C|nr:arsenate reductase ArsC [Arachidicoccus terrestris]UAY55362.1 arsenate reductase ArsC [Arachidicoccus terrestris]
MKTTRYRILFVCIHNSARSQMAETFLNLFDSARFEAESAGLEPGRLNPNVVAAMGEIGIDISNNKTTAAFDLVREGKHYDAVITVCDAASAEKCPVFPGKTKRIAWSFPDPSAFNGAPEQIMEQTRQVRDAIRQKVEDFVREASALRFWV